ncbi:MAG: FIST N-terminal domain-containing protein [Sporomusaceae bacterium]|nr:FIST N-terminal domain-containing protein [Sporomusaceae bacterium]
MLKAIVGHSEDIIAAEAAREAIDHVRCSLGEAQPQAGVLFCSVDFDHARILSAVRAAFPAMELVGCTTDGELSSALGFTEDSLTLLVFVSDTVEIRAGCGRDAARRGEEAGREAAANARSGMLHPAAEDRFAIILADPLNAGISDIDRGVQEVLGHTFPVIGGASAAHSKQRKTFQFFGGEVLTDSVVLLLFSGPVVFSCGLKGAFSPLGPRERVTKARNNVLYELDGKPAVDYFRRYTGNYDLFMNYCLAVYQHDRDSFFVRSAPFSDPEKGTVTLNGRIPEGATVQIGAADKKNLLASCTDSLCQALATYPGPQPAAALLFSCAGRKIVMGTRIAQEVQSVRRQLPGVPFAGFYCYGEFAPLERGAPYMFHGATFVTVLLGPAQEE